MHKTNFGCNFTDTGKLSVGFETGRLASFAEVRQSKGRSSQVI